MTAVELGDLMDQVSNALKENKASVTPETLDTISLFLTALKANPSLQAVIAGVANIPTAKVADLLKSSDGFLAVEKRLITTNMSDRLVSILDALKSRTIILHTIAPFVS